MHSVAYSDGMPPRARLYAERIMDVLNEVGAWSDKPVRAVKLNVINEPKDPTPEGNLLFVLVVDTTKSLALL